MDQIAGAPKLLHVAHHYQLLGRLNSNLSAAAVNGIIETNGGQIIQHIKRLWSIVSHAHCSFLVNEFPVLSI